MMRYRYTPVCKCSGCCPLLTARGSRRSMSLPAARAGGSEPSCSVLSAGAVNSAALLLRSGNIANSSGVIGRYFMNPQQHCPACRRSTPLQRTAPTSSCIGSAQTSLRTDAWLPRRAMCSGRPDIRMCSPMRSTAARRRISAAPCAWAPIRRPRCFLPHARSRQPVRGGCSLPADLGGGKSVADHRCPGAARCRPYRPVGIPRMR